MKFNIRNIHRDFGYFYVGLIISFAISGLMMNHRDHWSPEKYTINARAVKKVLPKEVEITEVFVKNLVANELLVKDKFKRHSIRKGKLKIVCDNHDIEFNLATGDGEIVEFKKTPLISQMMFLHKTNSNWWIYYSDVFALSLITIATTGILLIPKGRLSFKERGWKLAVAGLVFPLLFLIFFS
jgi:uncharacterized protein